MTVYVDEMFDGHAPGWRKGMWAHMWSDSGDEELLEFGAKIGLQAEWLQTTNPRFHHFDLRYVKREMALRRGAVYMYLHEWIQKMKEAVNG